jgi:hypothetical protein
VLGQHFGQVAQLPLAAHEAVQRHGQLLGRGMQGPQRREVGRQVRVHQLVDPLGLRDVPQPVLPEVPQLGP